MKKIKIALSYSEMGNNYTEALIKAGKNLGICVETEWFDCGKKTEGMQDHEKFRQADFDGLLIPGGRDIAPAFYGEEMTGSIDPDRETDLCQMKMLRDFIEAEKPILGICRGHQLVNVFLGGSLIQDLPEKALHVRLNPEIDNTHLIVAEEGSVLYELYGHQFSVNSSHHQGVKVLGKGLRIIARSPEGVVEGLEHEKLPILTFQFHPERMNQGTNMVDGGLIFEEFIKRCLKC